MGNFMCGLEEGADNSEKVAAVYDNRGRGGTFNTIKYAKKMGKEIFCLIYKIKKKDRLQGLFFCCYDSCVFCKSIKFLGCA